MSAVILSALLAAPPTALAGASIGSSSKFSSTARARAGQPEAFRSRASASGRVNQLHVYLGASSTATRVELGLYRNSSRRPSSRLARCVIATPRASAWNSCSTKRVRVRVRVAYWLTLLQPMRAKGRLRFRATRSGRRLAMRSSRARLKRLPKSWSRGRAARRRGRASLFADAAETFAPGLAPADRPATPGLPPLGQPSCVAGATPATTAAQVRSAVAAGQNVCVTTAVGDLNLDDLASDQVRHVGTNADGSIGEVHLQGASRVTLRARFESAIIDGSSQITIEQSRIGGTPANRILDVLLWIRERGDDITIRDNDIGWTTAPDVSGSEGYGIRGSGDVNRLRIERNYIHHIGADAIQLSLGGADTVVDRNEVAYAARPETSDEHSDDLQIIGNGPNMQVTNNYFHHCGWFTATGPTTGCNSMALHAGTSNTLLFENNVEAHALGLPFIGGLGTGGCERSNATFRRNTWWDNGTQFAGKPDLQFALCGGSGNLWERNLVVSTMNFSGGAGFAQSGTTARDNLVGNHAMSADGQCIAAACNRAGQDPIGYRKPAGVHW